MADRIEFSCNATPIETLAQDVGTDGPDVSASETYGALNGSGTITGWTQQTGSTGTSYGYQNGGVTYISSAAATTPTAFATIATIDFFYIKHTGKVYASGTALGADTSDYLTIRALKATDGNTVVAGSISDGEQPIIACLAPGQAIMLPLNATMDLEYFGHHSTTSNGTSAGGGTIAIQFFVGT
jgi:hypothetical protein